MLKELENYGSMIKALVFVQLEIIELLHKNSVIPREMIAQILRNRIEHMGKSNNEGIAAALSLILQGIDNQASSDLGKGPRRG